MPITADPAAPTAPDTGAPVCVEIIWTHREGTHLSGLLTLASLAPADQAHLEATDREDQWLIDGGTRRRTIDGMNDYTRETHHFARLTPAQAARAAADWLGFTGRPLAVRVIDETA